VAVTDAAVGLPCRQWERGRRAVRGLHFTRKQVRTMDDANIFDKLFGWLFGLIPAGLWRDAAERLFKVFLQTTISLIGVSAVDIPNSLKSLSTADSAVAGGLAAVVWTLVVWLATYASRAASKSANPSAA
jgi:hypothetical protein